MRGRTSGLGARTSSIALVILRSAEVHRAVNLLDERDLTSREAIFRVEGLVRPPPLPTQDWKRRWTDEALYAKYVLSASEIGFIEKVVRPMDLSGSEDD